MKKKKIKIRFSVEISPEANQALVQAAEISGRSRLSHASQVLERLFNPKLAASFPDIPLANKNGREGVRA